MEDPRRRRPVFATETAATPACDPLLLTGYYRTYPAYVEDEVRAALAAPGHFERGPKELSKRGTREDDTHAFVVEDGRYVSARWPGDAYLIARKLCERLAVTSSQR